MLDGGVAQAVPSSPTDPLTRPDTMTRSHPHTSLYRSNLYILFEIGFCLLFNYFRPPTLIRWNIETREYFAVASLTSSLPQNYLEADYAHPLRLLLKGNLTLSFVMIITLWYKVLFGELPLPAKQIMWLIFFLFFSCVYYCWLLVFNLLIHNKIVVIQ